MDDEVLDLSGLKCPLPALLARKALGKISPGAMLAIITTDPLAAVDIPHMCHEEGHSLESMAQEKSRAVFYIRRKILDGRR